ncbi:MAG: type II toxin-antitoxin system Phd/YefM family antitoxin [Roseimicrobium sp.]
MITVNMHEAKSRLSQLVLAALNGEEVILCSKGEPRVRLVPMEVPPIRRDLIPPDPALRATLAHGYDPAEPLSEDEWPSELR